MARLLCILVSVGVLLTPFRTLHAHIDGDHHHHPSTIHGGHFHDHETGTGTHSADKVVDLKFSMVDRAFSQQSGTDGPPPAYSIVPVALHLSVWTVILRPPSDDSFFPLPSYWPPPLRGPPVSIAAR